MEPCVICGDTKADKTLHQMPCGRHTMCPDCITATFRAAMNDETTYPPTCCSRGEAPPLLMDDFEHVVSLDMLLEYKQKELEYSVHPKSRIYCANPPCSRFIHHSTHHDTIATCPDCHNHTCTTCHYLYGSDTNDAKDTQASEETEPPAESTATQETINALPVSETTVTSITSASQARPNSLPKPHTCSPTTLAHESAFLTLATDAHYQQCPNCTRMIDLLEACNHMTCSCGHQFCYICRIEWTDYHGCPVYGQPVYDDEGYNQDGFDREGYSRTGYSRRGWDREGYNSDGFDALGRDREGYDYAGKDKDGFDREGFDEHGLDREGWSLDGFDTFGYDRENKNKDGKTRAEAEAAGEAEVFDVRGYNRDGFDRNGFGRDGVDRDGFNQSGKDAEGYDREGFNEAGYSRMGEHRDGNILDDQEDMELQRIIALSMGWEVQMPAPVVRSEPELETTAPEQEEQTEQELGETPADEETQADEATAEEMELVASSGETQASVDAAEDEDDVVTVVAATQPEDAGETEQLRNMVVEGVMITA